MATSRHYNWRCKVCEMVNEAQANHCAICGAPKILTPLHAEILTRTHKGLPPDEALLKEQSRQERMERMNPIAELIFGAGVMGILLGLTMFRFAWTVALHFWAIGLLIVSWLLVMMGSALEGALSNRGTVKDNRPEVLKEKP